MVRMIPSAVLFALTLVILPAPGAGQSRGAAALAIEYLANEGVMLRGGGASVVIDGLFGQGHPLYPQVPEPTRDSLENAVGRFGDIRLVLVTHVHRDHFDPRSVARHMRANLRATFIGPRQAVDSLRLLAGWVDSARTITLDLPHGMPQALRVADVAIEAIGIVHPHRLNRDVQHVVYRVTIDGTDVLHLGDSTPEPADLEFLPRSPDVLLTPFWLVGDSDVIPLLRAKRVLAFHLPRSRPSVPSSLRDGTPVALLPDLRLARAR